MPTAPRLLGRSGPLPGVVNGIDVSGGLAYVAVGSGGLRVFDVTDPVAPAEVAGLAKWWVTAVDANGALTYVAATAVALSQLLRMLVLRNRRR